MRYYGPDLNVLQILYCLSFFTKKNFTGENFEKMLPTIKSEAMCSTDFFLSEVRSWFLNIKICGVGEIGNKG